MYRSRSARALRETEDQFGNLDPWRGKLDSHSRVSGKRIFATVVMVGLTLGGGLAFLLRSQNSDASTPASTVAGFIYRQTAEPLREDFHSGLKSWLDGPEDSGARVWDGRLRPGGLRIWKPTQRLENYELEFTCKIERKGLGWGFRASDRRHYYGQKLQILRAGPKPNAQLVRLVVLDGKVLERSAAALSLTLNQGQDFHVRLIVDGGHFLTWVNGQIVSSWSDDRLKRGGVGFFAEDGEVSSLKWAKFSERDSMLGRILAHPSLLVLPWGY